MRCPKEVPIHRCSACGRAWEDVDPHRIPCTPSGRKKLFVVCTECYPELSLGQLRCYVRELGGYWAADDPLYIHEHLAHINYALGWLERDKAAEDREDDT